MFWSARGTTHGLGNQPRGTVTTASWINPPAVVLGQVEG
jgi:hypothetical protein